MSRKAVRMAAAASSFSAAEEEGEVKGAKSTMGTLSVGAGTVMVNNGDEENDGDGAGLGRARADISMRIK